MVEKEIATGTLPERIGYYTFTRAAANEAVDRATLKFSMLNRDDLVHFRTIHSECYRLLGLKRTDVMGYKDMREFSCMYGYRFSRPADSINQKQELTLQTRDDYLLFFEEWRRARCIDTFNQAYREFFALAPYDCPPLHLLIEFSARYNDFKRQKRLYDFTDMLTTVLHERLTPKLDVLILDEAQDNNPLEFEVVKLWASECARFYLCGDPMQAIYVFQGAEPNLFFTIPCDEKRVITQSHRVPEATHGLSIQLAKRTELGQGLRYLPTNKRGFVEFKSDLRSVQIDSERKYFILARNRCFLEPIEMAMLDAAYPFRNLRGLNPFHSNLNKALHTAITLSQGKKSTSTEINLLMQDFIPSKRWLKHGAKTKFAEMTASTPNRQFGLPDLSAYVTLDLVTLFEKGLFWDILNADKDELGYFKRIVSNNGIGSLNKEPNITLGTQHSVKGMECDIVICLSDMTRKTYRAYYTNPETEIPCWYVAATRAFEGMYIVEAAGGEFFDW